MTSLPPTLVPHPPCSQPAAITDAHSLCVLPYIKLLAVTILFVSSFSQELAYSLFSTLLFHLIWELFPYYYIGSSHSFPAGSYPVISDSYLASLLWSHGGHSCLAGLHPLPQWMLLDTNIDKRPEVELVAPWGYVLAILTGATSLPLWGFFQFTLPPTM